MWETAFGKSIDEGLSICDFGVVILSEAFFSKRWTKQELNALIARETAGSRNLTLPIWHKVDRHHVAEFSVLLADRMALRSSDGVEEVVEKIHLTIQRSQERWGDTRLLWIRLRYTGSYVQPDVADGLQRALSEVGAMLSHMTSSQEVLMGYSKSGYPTM